MNSIYSLLKENGIEIALISIDKNGYYDPTLKIMFINQALNEESQKDVILHELGHALNHKDLAALYNNPVFKSKMENEANCYMMKYLIKEYEGHFNYVEVFQRYKLGIGWEDKIN